MLFQGKDNLLITKFTSQKLKLHKSISNDDVKRTFPKQEICKMLSLVAHEFNIRD